MLPVNGRGQSRPRYQIEYEVCFWINVFTNKAGLIATSNAMKKARRHALNVAGLTFSSDVGFGIDIPGTLSRPSALA